MQAKKILTYATYILDGKEMFQYLPTSNIADVIHIPGMKWVREKQYFKDGEHFIEVPTSDKIFGVGEPLRSSDIVKRYYEGNPFFKNYDTDTIEYLKENPSTRWTLYGNGDVSLSWYDNYISVNDGEIPLGEKPLDVIVGDAHWYLELYHDDGTITYEKTLYDDKKYRGEECAYYMLVRVVEYEVNGEKRQALIERETNRYPYEPTAQTELDDLIDKAKGLLYHPKNFEGFAEASLLYTFNTEDSACIFYDHQDKIKDNVVTTVTGSSDAILDLFLYGAREVIAFDTNALTRFYGELKFIAAKYLSFSEFETFIKSLDENIYRKLEPFLSDSARNFWNEMYSYSKIIDKPIKDSEKGGLFYPTSSLFTANGTIYNPKGYYTEENYARLQQLLKDKTLDDITFVNCDLLELPKKVDLSNSSYTYLSNIMDFMVGVDKGYVDTQKAKAFKDFVLTNLLPALKDNASIDLSYIGANWHRDIDDRAYFDVYPTDEGFTINLLSNKKDSVLSYQSQYVLNKDSSQAKK